MAFNQLGSDPVKTPGNLSTVVGVLVTVESFEQEHPLIRAEMNGLSWLSHEWLRCLEWIDPVRFYKWSQGQACSAPLNPLYETFKRASGGASAQC